MPTERAKSTYQVPGSDIAGKRLGIIFGEFDPIHENHVRMMTHASQKVELVFVVVTNPKKSKCSAFDVRQEMVEARLKALRNDKIQLYPVPADSDFSWNGCSMICQGLLEQAQEDFSPDVEIMQIVGQDEFEALVKDPNISVKNRCLWIYPRLGHGILNIPSRLHDHIKVAGYRDAMEVSGENIRNECAEGSNPGSEVLSATVYDIIKKEKLYTEKRTVMPLIVITGGAGSGRTTLGRELASKLGYDFLSGDTVFKNYLKNETDPHVHVLKADLAHRWDQGMRNFAEWFTTKALERPSDRGLVLEGEGILPSKLDIIQKHIGPITCVLHLRCPPNECSRRLTEKASDFDEAHLRWKKNIGCRATNLKKEEKHLHEWEAAGGQTYMIRTHSLGQEEALEEALTEVDNAIKIQKKKNESSPLSMSTAVKNVFNSQTLPQPLPVLRHMASSGLGPHTISTPNVSPVAGFGMTQSAVMAAQMDTASLVISNYNNLMKTCLLARYMQTLIAKAPHGNMISVLDFCAGRGGDIGKLTHIMRINKKSMFYNAIDINENSVRHAKSRVVANEQIADANFFVGDCCKHGVVEALGKITNKMAFQFASCQFSVHYAFLDQDSAETFVQNVGSLLCAGGVFLVTTVSSEELGKRATWCHHHGRTVYDSQLYSINFGDSKTVKKFSQDYKKKDSFGLTYHFQLKSSAGCPEFMVTEQSLTELCKANGMELVAKRPLKALTQDPEFMPFVTRFRKRYDQHGGVDLDSNQMEIVDLYTAYVFRKTEGQDMEKLASDLNERPRWVQEDVDKREIHFVRPEFHHSLSIKAKEFQPGMRTSLRSDAVEFVPGQNWDKSSEESLGLPAATASTKKKASVQKEPNPEVSEPVNVAPTKPKDIDAESPSKKQAKDAAAPKAKLPEPRIPGLVTDFKSGNCS